jgi:hypothetical protein
MEKTINNPPPVDPTKAKTFFTNAENIYECKLGSWESSATCSTLMVYIRMCEIIIGLRTQFELDGNNRQINIDYSASVFASCSLGAQVSPAVSSAAARLISGTTSSSCHRVSEGDLFVSSMRELQGMHASLFRLICDIRKQATADEKIRVEFTANFYNV